MKNFKCTLLDNGLHITGDAENIMGESYPVSLLLSTEEANLPWDEAKEWVKEQGGALPTCAQLQAIQGHRDEINEAMKKAGKPIFDGYFWLDREHPLRKNCALCVNVTYGLVYYYSENDTDYVRSVSAFQI